MVGSNLRKEVPIIAHRIRKAALGGAAIGFVNTSRYDYHFDVSAYASGAGLVELLAGLAVASGASLSGTLASVCEGVGGLFVKEFVEQT